MRELNKRPDGKRFVPKLYDVLVHEYLDQGCDKSLSKPVVFIVMEHFKTDLREFIQTKLQSINELEIIKENLEGIDSNKDITKYIFANKWYSNIIYMIDTETGYVIR